MDLAGAQDAEECDGAYLEYYKSNNARDSSLKSDGELAAKGLVLVEGRKVLKGDRFLAFAVPGVLQAMQKDVGGSVESY